LRRGLHGSRGGKKRRTELPAGKERKNPALLLKAIRDVPQPLVNRKRKNFGKSSLLGRKRAHRKKRGPYSLPEKKNSGKKKAKMVGIISHITDPQKVKGLGTDRKCLLGNNRKEKKRPM